MDILTEILKVGGPTTAIAVIFYLIIKEQMKGSREREKEVMGLISNHMNHNTEVLKEVSERTKQDTQATKDLAVVLQGLKETLLKVNEKK